MRKFWIFFLFLALTNIVKAQDNVFSASPLILYPTDDVYTYKGGSGTGNEIRGMESTLQSYRNPDSQEYWWSIPYIKFDLQSINFAIENARLRLFGTVNEAHGFDIYKTSLTAWAEDALTFNNAAVQTGSISSNPIAKLDVTGNPAAQYYEWDITQAVVQAKNNGERYLSLKIQDRYAVKTSTGAGIVVRFHSKENASGNKPQLLVAQKDITTFELSELKVDGNEISDFAPAKTRYDITLPYNHTIIPIINATAANPEAAVIIRNAVNLTGTEAERTTRIVSTLNQDSVVYRVVFNLSASPDIATIDSLFTDNVFLENFGKDTYHYYINLPYTTTKSPEIKVKTTDVFAAYEISGPTNLFGSQEERTAVVEVTSQNQQNKKQYRIEFQVLPKLDLFLALGQSNMAGRGKMTAEDILPIENVYILTPKGNMEIATNPLNKYSSIRKELSMQQMSPSSSFLKTIRDKAEVSVGIMQNARGGSAINSWLKGSTDGYYEEAIRRAQEIRKFGEIKGIIWHQGESNSGDPNGYKTKLSRMVSDFRTDLNSPQLFFIAGEIAKWTGNQAFNTMIRTISTFIPYSDWASSEELTPLVDFSDPHFDAASVKILGERYAQKMLNNVYNLSGNEKILSRKLAEIYSYRGNLRVDTLQEKIQVSIYDIAGRQLSSVKLNAAETHFFPLQRGVYVVKISGHNGIQINKITVK